MCEDIELDENGLGEYLCPSCNEELECMGGMAHECTNPNCKDENLYMAEPIDLVDLN